MPLPANTLDVTAGSEPYLTGAGSEGNAVDATGKPVKPNEASTGASASSSASSGGSAASTPGGDATTKTTGTEAGADLWDSGWPTGGFYWTVVPVTVVGIPPKASVPVVPGVPPPPEPVIYQDTAVGQDACEAGDVMSFGKNSKPVVTVAGKPFISGVAPGRDRRQIEARGLRSRLLPGSPASRVEVLSRFRGRLSLAREMALNTQATSMVLPLTKPTPARYRAGDDSRLPVRAPAWSAPTRSRSRATAAVVK